MRLRLFPFSLVEDVNFVGNSNNGFRQGQGFNSRRNKPNLPFDNCQQGDNGQNFNNGPPLRDIIRDQLKINEEIGKKFLASNRILESIDGKMNNFTIAVQNQFDLNKLLEARIAKQASTPPHPKGTDFSGQPVSPPKENVKAVITRSEKTTTEPKIVPKKTTHVEPEE